MNEYALTCRRNPVEGWMSGNAGDQNGQNGRGGQQDTGSASAETCMRLEIARLELEIEQMRAGRMKSSTSSTEGLSVDLTEYL